MTDMLIRDVPDEVILAVDAHGSPDSLSAVWMSAAASAHDAAAEHAITITALPRQECAATVLGEPTTVLDIGWLRIVSDPTFDDPGPHGYLAKTAGPALAEDDLGPTWSASTRTRTIGGWLRARCSGRSRRKVSCGPLPGRRPLVPQQPGLIIGELKHEW
jgi:hypothetical protein